jgi:protein O-GlcNAc transferase
MAVYKIAAIMAQVSIQQAFDLALQHHQAERLAEAENLCRRILAHDPAHVDAVRLSGMIAYQLGRNDIAANLFRRAIALCPDFPAAYVNLGNSLTNMGQLDEAIAAYRQAIALRPGYAEAYSNLGNALTNVGQLDEAIAACRQAIALRPNYAKAHNNLGVALRDRGQLDEAIAAYRQAIILDPNLPEAHTNLGNVLRSKERLDEAIAAYRQAIVLSPRYAGAYSNLGNVLRDKGQLDEAIAAHRQAIALVPNFAGAYTNLGNALADKGQLDDAIAAHRQAIALKPNYAEAHSNLGNALRDKGQLIEAIAACRQAITLRPNYAGAYSNLGSALTNQGQLDEAVAAYRQAIFLQPNLPEAHNNLGNALRDIGELDEAVAAYRQAIALRPDYAGAYSNLVYALHFHPGYDAQAIAEEHRRWNRQHAEPLRQFIQPHNNPPHPDRRLRVGYVSADFRNHSVSRFLLPLLRHHDHSAFEIICYSDVANGDAMTDSLRACADGWHNIVGYADERVANKVREDKIDILVDLAGHTAGNRLQVFALKPAPVQITYLGYPGTTGLSQMDYRLSDLFADPPGETESLHTEKLWRLPVCNWCCREPDDAPPVRPSRSDGPICFGTFNNFAKASPAIMDLWAAILMANPSSRLIIKSRGLGEPSVRRRIAQFFQSRGVPADRLDIRGSEPDVRSHLLVYNQLDIALDSFPYHGTTTTCDALWMGVPVVTLAGPSHVSRVGVSLLSCIGLPELIAQSPEEYVSIAVGLAGDFARLAELRRTLRERMRASPLMDAPRFARNIEAAYRQMWRTWCETHASHV